jgi:protein-S-isoprenylcysteine O-methyltransferase Ste14
MDVYWVRIAAVLIVLSSAAITIRFKLALRRNSKPQRSQAEPAWLPHLIASTAILLGAATLWAILRPNSFTDAISIPSNDLPISGLILGSMGCLLMYSSLASLGKNFSGTSGTDTTHQLITAGPYRYIRHPYYTATAAIITGLALLLSSLAIFCLGSLLMYLLNIRSYAEEHELRELFGEAFKNWEATTGKFLPRFRRKTSHEQLS